jgi:hypothetical protein
MKPLSRRSVTTGMVAAVTAIPAVILSVSARADTRDDKLLALIGRYNSELAAINASGDISDEELDACIDRTDAILAEAAGLPVLTAAGALAALDLVVKESSHSVLGDSFLDFIRAVRDYTASTYPTQA